MNLRGDEVSRNIRRRIEIQQFFNDGETNHKSGG